MDIKEYKKISLEFRRYASNVLNTEYSNYNSPLYRLKNYIDTQPIIMEIINNQIKNVEFDYEECFNINSSDWSNINIPIDERKHMKAMYDFLDYIVSNNMDVMRLAMTFCYSSKNITEIIRNFLTKCFKPMIDFIIDELAKEIVMLEEDNVGINISGNSGNINFASQGSVINSNITNSFGEIKELLRSNKEDIIKSEIPSEVKENMLDDFEVIEEQIEDSIKKPTRLKKAIENIKKILISPQGIALGTTVINNINRLIDALQELVKQI